MATGAKRRRVESDALSSASPFVLLDCQLRLKKALVGKESVERFLAHQQQFQQVRRLSPAKMTGERTVVMSPRLIVRRISLQLLGLVCRCSERRALAADDRKAAWDSVVKECLSVIANCCHFSFAACQEVCVVAAKKGLAVGNKALYFAGQEICQRHYSTHR